MLFSIPFSVYVCCILYCFHVLTAYCTAATSAHIMECKTLTSFVIWLYSDSFICRKGQFDMLGFSKLISDRNKFKIFKKRIVRTNI